MQNQTHPGVGSPVPDYQFDQKNDMFRRGLWDEPFEGLWEQFFDAKYKRIGRVGGNATTLPSQPPLFEFWATGPFPLGTV